MNNQFTVYIFNYLQPLIHVESFLVSHLHGHNISVET
jgi:hypothetical protein